MPRHSGYRVVENDDGRIRRVVCDVDKPRHARMHERGVSDDRDSPFFSVRVARFIEAVNSRNGCAHAKSCVERVKRRLSAECVASDVPENGHFVFREDIIHSSVRTARAHHRRTDGNGLFKFGELFVFEPERFRDLSLRKFAQIAEKRLSLDFQTERAAMIFDNGIEFFYNDKAIDL